MTMNAAGIMFVSPAGRVLLLRRQGQDHAGEWAFPGGAAEETETPEETACRECVEEIGFLPDGVRIEHARRVKDDVDFVTFMQRVETEFVPKLNSEHSCYAWVMPEHLLADDGVAPPPTLTSADYGVAGMSADDGQSTGYDAKNESPHGNPSDFMWNEQSIPINHPGSDEDEMEADAWEESKLSHADGKVLYRVMGSPAQRCGICSMFVPPSSCTKVVDPISPLGVCDLFERGAI